MLIKSLKLKNFRQFKGDINIISHMIRRKM